MKKVFAKLRRNKQPEQPGRITTETIAEHRERMLAGGRRFKYPVQYARHKLVFNAIIIAVVSLVLLVLTGWQQLYIAQNSSDFMYRVTRVIPVSVAKIDDQSVRYSDFLLKYRGSIHYLREIENVNFDTEDGKRRADFVRSQEMNDAIVDAYAMKLAKEREITVSDTELAEVLRQQRMSDRGEQSEAAYYSTVRDYYGWSSEEYREITRVKLLRQKVAFAVDANAEDAAGRVKALITGGATDLKAIADEVNKATQAGVTYGALGFLPLTNQDGGLTAAAAKLEVGQISDAVRSTNGEGYFFVKLIEKNDKQVNYQYVQVPLRTLMEEVRQAQESDSRVLIYIDISEVTAPQQQ